MTDPDSRYLDAFPEWLRGLGVDARALAAVVEREDLPDAVRRQCAAALNYLFKSVDLIPDGIEDLGFIDDAFVCDHADPVAVRRVEGAELHGWVLGRPR